SREHVARTVTNSGQRHLSGRPPRPEAAEQLLRCSPTLCHFAPPAARSGARVVHHYLLPADCASAGLPSSFSFSVEGTRTVKTESKQITRNPIKSRSSGQRDGGRSLGSGMRSERMRAGTATPLPAVELETEVFDNRIRE